MVEQFKECLPGIIKNIIKEINGLVINNYTDFPDTFYGWFMTNSDYDFLYIYEMNFKKYFEFTIETQRILSYYSQNLFYAIGTYYEMYRDLTSVQHFINIFITKQLEFIDEYQLYLK